MKDIDWEAVKWKALWLALGVVVLLFITVCVQGVIDNSEQATACNDVGGVRVTVRDGGLPRCLVNGKLLRYEDLQVKAERTGVAD